MTAHALAIESADLPSTRQIARKLAVAAGTASTLEVGAGLFDPRDAGRMVSAVEVVELAPVG